MGTEQQAATRLGAISRWQGPEPGIKGFSGAPEAKIIVREGGVRVPVPVTIRDGQE